MRLDMSDTVLIGAVLLCCATVTTAKAIQKREISPDMLFQAKDKRPFCNAFTGCGRKRSDVSMLEEATGSVGLNSAAQLPPAQVDTRLWEDMLSMLLSARQDQAAPQLYRGRRSILRQEPFVPTPQGTEAEADQR